MYKRQAPGSAAAAGPPAHSDSTRPVISATAPVTAAPDQAATRTASRPARSATTTSTAAVTSSAHPKTTADAPAYQAHSTNGNWPANRAAGNGTRSRPTASPYTAHTPASTADAAAANPAPSVPGRTAACSA